jgi:hypothetical protein
VPTLAEELATDDIVAAGWTIDGPTALPDGGLTITLSHAFTSDAEATNLLNSLGPPFNQMAVTRNTSGEDTTTRLTGLLGLPDGFESFADEDLIAAVGSVPFGDQIAASGATPESSINAVIRAALPGRIDSAETNGITARRQPPGVAGADRRDDPRLARRVGPVAGRRPLVGPSPLDHRLVALVAWVSFMTLFIGYVLWARWQRTRRRSRRTPSRSRRWAQGLSDRVWQPWTCPTLPPESISTST